MTKQQELDTALAGESVELSCVRGCVRRGTEHDEIPELLGARHGRFCDRCFFRTRSALRLAPSLAAHIASLVGTKLVGDSAGAVAKDAPLPMNAQAFDDLNGVYEQLVMFSGLFAARLKVDRPLAAQQAWRTPTGRVKGFPVDTSPWWAESEVRRQAVWLEDHLERIFGCAVVDEYVDVIAFFVDEVGHFNSIERRWKRPEMPRYSAMPHSDGVTSCWQEKTSGAVADRKGVFWVAVFPPPTEGGSMVIRCEVCGHVWSEDEYEADLIRFEMWQRPVVVAKRVTKSLMKRWMNGEHGYVEHEIEGEEPAAEESGADGAGAVGGAAPAGAGPAPSALDGAVPGGGVGDVGGVVGDRVGGGRVRGVVLQRAAGGVDA